MPNTRSAAKALRQSKKKQEHNLFWKRRISAMKKAITKSLETPNITPDILKQEQSALQKVVDKAAKENVIHKNKASRIKSRYANKIAAHENKVVSKKTESKTSTDSKKSGKSGSKSSTKKSASTK